MKNDLPILEMKDLAVGYVRNGKEHRVYENITALAFPGELVALMGRNGTGKSTLLRSLSRMISPLGGSVELEGKALGSYPRHELAKKIAWVSTDPLQIQHMKVADLVGLGRYPWTGWMGTFSESDRERVWKAMDAVGITGLAANNIHEISDGERQRALIARALAQDTDLILLDEPTAYLDLGNRYGIIQLLTEISRKENKCVLFSTHDWQMAMSQADMIWLMDEKCFVAGAPEDLALNNRFDGLIGTEHMRFDPRTGQLRLLREELFSVDISGGKEEVFWTRRALERIGCRFREKDPDWRIRISGSGTDREWTALSVSGVSIRTASLYQLLEEIRKTGKKEES